MKNFAVTKVVWANYGDMDLPFYREWNEKNRLPRWFWQRIWEYPFVCLHVPKNEQSLDVCGTYPFVLFKHFPKAVSLDNRDLNKLDHKLHKGLWPKGKLIVADAQDMPFADDQYRYSFSISAIEETPDPLKVIQEMIRITKDRVVVTMDISDIMGVDRKKLQKVIDYLKIALPPVPEDVLRSDSPRQREFGQRIREEFNHIKVLGLVIDRVETNPKSVGILIPHCESLPFLKTCITQIKQYSSPEIRQHIYVLDDDSKDGSFEKAKEQWGSDPEVTMVSVTRTNKSVPDVGQLLDKGLEYVKEKYVCMIDADVFPTSSHWLSYPIYLLEKFYCSSVGTDTGLSNAYLDIVPGKWSNDKEYNKRQKFGVYSNEYFTCTNNFYRIAKTVDAQIVSGLASYRRIADPVNKAIKTLLPKPLAHLCYRLLRRFPNADNGVKANYFIDANHLGPKFSLPISGWIGQTPRDGVFGQNVLGLIFHFALSSRVFSGQHKEISDPGVEYLKIGNQILKQGFSSDLLGSMFATAKKTRNERWATGGFGELQQQAFEKSFQEYQKACKAHKYETQA